ncbi:MAG TPA: YeeE/YedE thiosulfate transporter family protein [Vicinamibacterales bacterium]|jgi:uncharacterized membrane protein YedE/YeeE|nr:YeeE/YedE thiosulfate transporter family protein [Vicinamibacterales bacterium]
MKYSDPYLSGIALGLVLLAAFVFAGRGLGASGAFASAASSTVHAVAPDYARGNAYFTSYVNEPGGPWRSWLVIEIAGVFIGALASSVLAGRWKRGVERGVDVSAASRIVAAAGGGALMGIGAMLARGCTSGQALTGGALLSVGAWAFIACAFAAGYAVAPLRRRAWRA